MAKRETKKTTAISDREIDSWVESNPPPTSCRTCNHAAGGTLKRLLQAMIRKGSHNVTLRRLHGKLQELHPDYKTGFWGFRDHLYVCERELYEQSKRGRTHV